MEHEASIGVQEPVLVSRSQYWCPGAIGWALAIPINHRLGTTPPLPPPGTTFLVTLLGYQSRDEHAVTVPGPLGHAHMTVLTTTKEILGVEYAQVSQDMAKVHEICPNSMKYD